MKSVNVRYVNLDKTFPCKVIVDRKQGKLVLVKDGGLFSGHEWEVNVDDIHDIAEMIADKGDHGRS